MLKNTSTTTERGSEIIEFSKFINVPKFNFIVKRSVDKNTDNMHVVGFPIISDVIDYKLKWESLGETVFVYKLQELEQDTILHFKTPKPNN
tara:strand:+ start:373 stop:645 length:273 start_codon:yes stop_codon:yes gene_type:complete